MSSTPAAGRPNRERELVYCHECREEWYRDEHGLVCPSCGSDFVEIIEGSNDPREEEDGGLEDFLERLTGRPGHGHDHSHDRIHDHDHDHEREGHQHHGGPGGPFRSVSPGSTTFVRVVNGPGFHYESTRTYRSPPPRDGDRTPGDDMVVNLFTQMFQNILGDHNFPPRPPAGAPQGDNNNNNQGQRLGVGTPPQSSPGGQPQRGPGAPPPNPFAPFFMPSGVRLSHRDANAAPPSGEQQVVDLSTFLATIFGAPLPGGDEDHHMGTHPLGPAFLARLFPGVGGDYVYSQEELDRVITSLMEQHQGNAPPPAPKEAIDSLPKVKVSEEMVTDGADCAVCKEDLVLDEEVTKLPCKHVYHFDCVSKWLEVHDTCPICRHPITSEDKQREQREQQRNNRPYMGWGIPPPAPEAGPSFHSTSSGSSSGNNDSNQGSSPAPEQNQRSSSSGGHGGIRGFAGLFRGRRNQ